jgi:hypothetical protein
MPLASLSTFAVMKPGPTTAKNSSIRIFQLLSNLITCTVALDLNASHCGRSEYMQTLELEQAKVVEIN